MTLQEIETKITTLETERSAVWEQIAPLRQRQSELYEEIRALKERRDELRLSQPGELDWRTIIKDLASDNGSVTLLRYADKHLQERFNMYSGGRWSDTGEACFKITVDKADADETERKSIEAVRFFTPLLTPHDDGYVWFGIFEHTLSAGGIYELRVKPDFSRLLLCKTTWGRTSTIQEFSSVEEAIRYIRDHHWYGETEDDNAEESD